MLKNRNKLHFEKSNQHFSSFIHHLGWIFLMNLSQCILLLSS